MKINKIALVAALASTMATTIAQAQIKITGYLESSYMTGSGKGISGAMFTPNGAASSSTANTTLLDPQKGLGNESQLRFTSTHSVMGMNAEAMLEFRRPGATGAVYEERELRLSSADGSMVAFVGTDFQRGLEIARNVYPSVNNRAGDIMGSVTGIIDPLDSTSSESYIGFELPKLGGSTRVSFAYAPQLATSGQMTSFNSDVLGDRSATINQDRYSIGVVQPIGPITLGLGYMGGQNKMATTGVQDPESKTIGLRYVAGPVGLGAQYFVNNNPTATATKNEDKQRTVSGTYALTKELSVGLIYTVQENTALGVTDPDKIKQHVVQAGYNLGPVALQADYARVRDAQYINNQEVDLVKLKAKVNF